MPWLVSWGSFAKLVMEMVKAGSIVTVYDPDLQDMYIAEVLKDNPKEQSINTLVKILWMVRYPIQYAILCPSVPNENVPVFGGSVCRLRFYHYASDYMIPYGESLQDALREAIALAREAGRNDILEILYRHQRGEYKGKRSLLTA